jgi:hypothetical protein
VALKITSRSVAEYHSLEVRAEGVRFIHAMGFTKKHSFRFSQIACVLMSGSHKLSFQVGNEVFSIQTKPRSSKHRMVVDELLRKLGQVREEW